MEFDYKEIQCLEFEDIDYNDYPDFCDAHISKADYKGSEMTDEELDDLNMNHSQFVYESLWDWIH